MNCTGGSNDYYDYHSDDTDYLYSDYDSDSGGNSCYYLNENGFPEDIQYALEFVALLVVGGIGVLGNIAAIVMFGNLKNQLNFHRLMITISIFDNAYIVLNLAIYSFPYVSEKYRYGDTYCYILLIAGPFKYVALTGSIFSTMAISIERYLVVCHPFFTLSHKWTAKMYILPIMAFSFVYNIPKFFEYIIEEPAGQPRHSPNSTTKEPSMLSLERTEMRENVYYATIYLGWMNFVIMAIVPFTLLLTLNTLIFVQLRKQLTDRKQDSVIGISGAPGSLLAQSAFHPDEDQSCVPVSARPLTKYNEILLAKVNFFITFFFVICHSVKWIPNVYEIIYAHFYLECNFTWPHWIQVCTNISTFLTTLNSSVNFYIYVITHLHVLSPNGMTVFMCCKKTSSQNYVDHTTTAIPLLDRNRANYKNGSNYRA